MLNNICKIIFKLQEKISKKILKKYYENLLKKCGKGLKIYGKINIKNPQNIEIGMDTSLNENVYLNGMYGIKIGDNCAISANCMIISTMLDKEKLINQSIKNHVGAKIEIGNCVQLGAGSILLPGVKIGNNVIIGAGSIVTKNIPDNAIAYGNPAIYKKF